MPLSDSQVKAEQAGPRRRNVSVGDSLFLVIESVSGGGGKSFEGRMRFPHPVALPRDIGAPSDAVMRTVEISVARAFRRDDFCSSQDL